MPPDPSFDFVAELKKIGRGPAEMERLTGISKGQFSQWLKRKRNPPEYHRAMGIISELKKKLSLTEELLPARHGVEDLATMCFYDLFNRYEKAVEKKDADAQKHLILALECLWPNLHSRIKEWMQDQLAKKKSSSRSEIGEIHRRKKSAA